MISLDYYLNNKLQHKASLDTLDYSIERIEDGNRLKYILSAKNDIKLKRAYKVYTRKYNDSDVIFANGYQSWTDSHEYTINHSFKDIKHSFKPVVKKFGLDKYGDSSFIKYKKHVLHAFDYSYVRGIDPLFIGSHNSDNAYLIIRHDIKNNKIILDADVNGLTLKANESIVLMDFEYNVGPLEVSIHSFVSQYKNEAPKIFGYTSWYNHYQNINEEIILDNLNSLDERFNLFQIDDGYETYVGDWLSVDKNKFPNGLEPIAKKIKERNLTAGIWLAPFVAEEKSDLFINHKDLFFKDSKNRPVKAGGNWSGFYVLDIYNPQTLEYIKKSLEYYKNMGFTFFKLDFLYAVNLCNYPGKTRAMVTSFAYKFLRTVLKDDKVLGCGAVISCSNQTFDYLRIGPDVTLKFDDVWYMKHFHRERISTKISIQNTIYRSIFNNYFFGNDPDVFLLRDTNISLSKKQKEALATINALFGNVLMTSDNIAEYDEDNKRFLESILYINQHAKNPMYTKRGKIIYISYDLDGKLVHMTYNTKKGIFID